MERRDVNVDLGVEPHELEFELGDRRKMKRTRRRRAHYRSWGGDRRRRGEPV